MLHDTEVSASICEQAAYWWAVFHDEEATAADHREFAEWVARSPERVEAYLEVARLQQGLSSPGVCWPATPAEILIREARAAPDDVLRMPGGSMAPAATSRRGAPTFRMRFAMSLAAALLIGVGTAWFILTSPEVYATKFGEQRSIRLDDGSRITLNTSSKIEVELRKDHRRVRLVQGEALFDVAHDASRPFDVTMPQAVLRVLGTQFAVNIGPRRTTVTVVEGRVAMLSRSEEVQVPILAAADRLVIDAAGGTSVQHGVNVSSALSWTHRQLVFERRPLVEVADEFNRYNRDRIEIRDETLRTQEITGVFQSDDVASFIAFLSDVPGVTVQVDSAGTHVVTFHRSEVSPK
jgi:transmembrane sensor